LVDLPDSGTRVVGFFVAVFMSICFGLFKSFLKGHSAEQTVQQVLGNFIYVMPVLKD
jgi:hypothetical protein